MRVFRLRRQFRNPLLQRHGTRAILECLRELGAAFLTLPALLKLGVVPLVEQLYSHPHPQVAKLAADVSDR